MSGSSRMVSAQPSVAVADVERAFEFYERLGFCKYYQNLDLHLVIERDDVILHLATQLVSGVCGCQIMVRDVDSLYREVVEMELPIKLELQDEPWGCRDFTVIDPDGNMITFSEFLREPGE